jgi:hypothetical protein
MVLCALAAGTLFLAGTAFAVGSPVLRAHVPTPPVGHPPLRIPAPPAHHPPAPLSPEAERGLIAGLGTTTGHPGMHVLSDSHQLPYTLSISTQTTSNLTIYGAFDVDMGGDESSRGSSAHQASAAFNVLAPAAATAALTGWPPIGVEIQLPVTAGTSYLLDCSVEDSGIQYAYIIGNSQYQITDQGVESSQGGHLILSHFAPSDGWAFVRFVGQLQTSNNSVTWYFDSCKVTPLGS